MAKFFIKNAGVIIEGAEQFVHNAEGHIRINIAVPREVMKKDYKNKSGFSLNRGEISWLLLNPHT